MTNARALTRTLAGAQGVYFLITGLWPIFHMRSFEAVTGPKRERWLVKTVGVLAASIGAPLFRRYRCDTVDDDAAFLAMTSAAGFAAVDLWYAGARRRISPVYLLDAVAELGLCAAWAVARRR
jgi:hypothetical protein